MTSALLCGQVGVPLQVKGPALAAAHALAQALPALTVAVEVAVLELDPRALVGLGDEADLHLAGPLQIGLELPVGAYVPADHHSVRRLVGQHPRPPALASVHAPVI